MKKLIVLSLCATILLAACQPTPEKQVVIQKDMEQMIEKAIAAPEVQPAEEVKQSDAAKEKNPLYDKLGIPERWIAGDEALNGKFVIKADTDIALPEADKLPIVRVQAGRFSQEMVDRFFEVFCGDTVMYEDTGERDKQYYADYILKLQQSLAKIDEADNADKEESSRLREKTQAHIEELEKQYKKAPDHVEYPICGGRLKTNRIDENKLKGSNTYIQAYAKPGDYNSTMIEINNDAEYTMDSSYAFKDEYGNTVVVSPSSGSYVWFCRDGVTGSKSRSRNLVDPVRDVTAESLSGESVETKLGITPKQARERAQETLDALGLDYMAIDRVELCQGCREENKGVQSYCVRVLRSINGTPLEGRNDYSESEIEGVGVGREWWYESCEIVVDDEGIASFYWMGPLEVTDILGEDANLIPFEDVENVFLKMLPVVNGDWVSRAETAVTYTVEKVRLALWRIIEKDSYTKGLLVPVWNIYCASEYTTELGEPYSSSALYYNKPTLCINAIDGSIIDTERGY